MKRSACSDDLNAPCKKQALPEKVMQPYAIQELTADIGPSPAVAASHRTKRGLEEDIHGHEGGTQWKRPRGYALEGKQDARTASLGVLNPKETNVENLIPACLTVPDAIASACAAVHAASTGGTGKADENNHAWRSPAKLYGTKRPTAVRSPMLSPDAPEPPCGTLRQASFSTWNDDKEWQSLFRVLQLDQHNTSHRTNPVWASADRNKAPPRSSTADTAASTPGGGASSNTATGSKQVIVTSAVQGQESAQQAAKPTQCSSPAWPQSSSRGSFMMAEFSRVSAHWQQVQQ
eukprot:CAMPEP_0202896516 /NCGR_PEP_ID=MMETSP1392-20130828/5511_1 /ASSEMBLY_ACC=CAM_ASM_000868 /TAXON_ID=225041 /ORGANISM="Chlamydomonas chlamydogama, Strain SAG 11-48b" /LENGTH=290 /DNA_ID=CAMNT_0049581903 /DNA_START=115 /DNA_END=984 /DNA_ORIENTATION=+